MRWFANLDAVTADMQRIGIWGPITLFILFVFQVFLAFIPGQALMVACGYLYGFWGGFLLSWFSLVVGGELAAGDDAAAAAWVRLDEIDDLPLTSSMHDLIDLLRRRDDAG